MEIAQMNFPLAPKTGADNVHFQSSQQTMSDRGRNIKAFANMTA
jgi:hypothetical protein